MSAFTPMDRDTTPWLSDMARNHGCILFKNSYSCAMHTVEALERALTQRNQYNNLPFLDAPSIVDIAHKLGYHVHWYSNQGHLGANDTTVSLIAETADVARWTHQQLGKVQYDHTLLDFLDELDPSRDNFLVVHLKGSHFNFLNRYPAEATVWGTPGVQDDAINYLNSIRYTDGVLHKIYDYCVDRLNLQAMVYFSDHATVPDRHRSPNFDGFGHVRIPLAVWLSDEYRDNHPYRTSALQANADKYFTNDLAFELLCGLLDIRSSAFDESASLASETYRFNPADLLTYNATIPITADPTPKA
jgi:heptose-I-phosphate ethanolaminephosphotransferase